MERLTLSLIIIIIMLILYNWFIFNEILCGAWIATNEFLEEAEVDEFVFHIEGTLLKTFKAIIMKDSEIIVIEGSIFFLYLNPFSYISLCKSFGSVFLTNVEEKNKEILPSSMYFNFNPVNGLLEFYGEKVFGSFMKS